MQVLWHAAGRAAFWICLPLLHVYLRLNTRTRVLIIADKKVLVVRGWLGNQKWHLPGGGLHRNEPAVTGAIREVAEETGVSLLPGQMHTVGLTTFTGNGLYFKYHQFIVQLPKIRELQAQKGEIIAAEWIDLDELNLDNAEADVVKLLAAWKDLPSFDTI